MIDKHDIHVTFTSNLHCKRSEKVSAGRLAKQKIFNRVGLFLLSLNQPTDLTFIYTKIKLYLSYKKTVKIFDNTKDFDRMISEHESKDFSQHTSLPRSLCIIWSDLWPCQIYKDTKKDAFIFNFMIYIFNHNGSWSILFKEQLLLKKIFTYLFAQEVEVYICIAQWIIFVLIFSSLEHISCLLAFLSNQVLL